MRRGARRAVVALALGSWLAAGACRAVDGAPPRRLLLITVDTLRPDALGWVAGRNRTPTLDALAAEGFRFPRAVTPVPLTLPAHVSLLTGLVPPRHGVRDNGQTLAPEVRTLAQTLRQSGFATAAFVSGYPLDSIFGLDVGFDTYDDVFPRGREGWVERAAADTTTAAATWIAAADARRPWFVWVHYYDPHEPYEPPRAFWKPGPRGAYDGEVQAVDSAVAALLAAIPQSARAELLTVFAADHGEALGEHLERTHGFFVYDSTMLVPLVLRGRGIEPGESAAAARLIDVVPTVLELMHLADGTADLDGASLVPLLRGGGEPEPAYLETQLPWRYFGWAPLDGVRTARHKLVRAPEPELYDLVADPEERVNRFAEEPALAAELLSLLDAAAASAAAPAAPAASAEALERLRTLGYVGAAAPPPARATDLADPKHRIELREAVADAEARLRSGDFRGALAGFEAVLAADPANRAALLRAGVAQLKAGDPGAAVSRLSAAARLDPERAEARWALADALVRSGELERAVGEWQALVRLQPLRSEGWANLGATLRSLGRETEARAALERARELVDQHRPG